MRHDRHFLAFVIAGLTAAGAICHAAFSFFECSVSTTSSEAGGESFSRCGYPQAGGSAAGTCMRASSSGVVRTPHFSMSRAL